MAREPGSTAGRTSFAFARRKELPGPAPGLYRHVDMARDAFDRAGPEHLPGPDRDGRTRDAATPSVANPTLRIADPHPSFARPTRHPEEQSPPLDTPGPENARIRSKEAFMRMRMPDAHRARDRQRHRARSR